MKSKTVHMETRETDYLHSAPVKLIMQAAFDNFYLIKGYILRISTHFMQCSELFSLSKHG
jgi:hypothetical protein